MSEKPPTVTTVAVDLVDRLVPSRYRPLAVLARLDRPTGALLLLWPCWWGLAMAADGLPNILLMAWLAIGAIVMRGAGCVYNDFIDRDIDAQVARTRDRPLVSGAVTSRQALQFLAVLLAGGLIVLLPLNRAAIVIAMASIPLVALYPFMKRMTNWPQAWLGLTFNWGVLVGWAAETAHLAPPAFALFAAGALWTLGYDTIYAHQDKEDDALVGVKSTALTFGKATRLWLLAFYGGCLAALAGAGYLAGLSLVYYAVLLIAAGHFLWQVTTVRIDDAASCLAKFNANKWLGAIIFVAIVLGQLIPLPLSSLLP